MRWVVHIKEDVLTGKTVYKARFFLSSAEAGYFAMSQCAQKIKFVAMLLNKVTGGKNILTSILCEDIMGAIFTGENQQIGTRRRHIDINYHHIKNMIDKGPLYIVFI